MTDWFQTTLYTEVIEWYGTGNRLEPVSDKSDGEPPTGIRCELSAVDKAVTLPLSRLPVVLSHIEWLTLALQNPALEG